MLDSKKLYERFPVRKTEGPKIGLELEYEGGLLCEGHPRGWEVIGDGSLRNGGLEFVSRGPKELSFVPTHLSNLIRFFKSQKLSPQKSIRTSTHVHINVADKTLEEIDQAIFLWALVEPFVLEFMPEERVGNPFAVLYSVDFSWVDRYLESHRKDFSSCLGERKYRSLSIERTFDLGTLEARILPAFLPEEFETLVGWIDFFVSLLRRGFEDYKTYENLLDSFFDKDTYKQFFEELFGEVKEIWPFTGEELSPRNVNGSFLYLLAVAKDEGINNEKDS